VILDDSKEKKVNNRAETIVLDTLTGKQESTEQVLLLGTMVDVVCRLSHGCTRTA
jgi:hypothetical protein